MSDLSRLLGDVYSPDPSADDRADDAPRPVTALPEWADDEVLDQAFSSWVPGPPADAPAAERNMLSDLAQDAAQRAAAQDTNATPSSRDFDPADAHDTSDEYVPEIAAADPDEELPPWKGGWQRSDDDILPRHTKRGLFRR